MKKNSLLQRKKGGTPGHSLVSGDLVTHSTLDLGSKDDWLTGSPSLFSCLTSNIKYLKSIY